MAHTHHTKNPMFSSSLQTPTNIYNIYQQKVKQILRSEEMKENFNERKSEYETALKSSICQKAELKFCKEEQNTKKRKRSCNIIWFNPPFSRNATTNVAKKFLNLLDKHFPKSNKLRKNF